MFYSTSDLIAIQSEPHPGFASAKPGWGAYWTQPRTAIVSTDLKLLALDQAVLGRKYKSQ
jgi:hypothetical protein